MLRARWKLGQFAYCPGSMQTAQPPGQYAYCPVRWAVCILPEQFAPPFSHRRRKPGGSCLGAHPPPPGQILTHEALGLFMTPLFDGEMRLGF